MSVFLKHLRMRIDQYEQYRSLRPYQRILLWSLWLALFLASTITAAGLLIAGTHLFEAIV